MIFPSILCTKAGAIEISLIMHNANEERCTELKKAPLQPIAKYKSFPQLFCNLYTDGHFEYCKRSTI